MCQHRENDFLCDNMMPNYSYLQEEVIRNETSLHRVHHCLQLM